MISNRDIWATAKMLVDQHGAEASKRTLSRRRTRSMNAARPVDPHNTRVRDARLRVRSIRADEGFAIELHRLTVKNRRRPRDDDAQQVASIEEAHQLPGEIPRG